MSSANEAIGGVAALRYLYGSACVRCGRVLPPGKLNYEAMIHHGARKLECIDRKDCERAKRKAARKARS